MFSGMLGTDGCGTLELAGAGAAAFFASQISWLSNTGRALAWPSSTSRATPWISNTGFGVVWVSNT